MRRMLRYLLLLLLVALAGCSAVTDSTPKANTWYPVTGYVDGDTFKIQVGNENKTIRLLYIDTPETKKPNAPVEAYGPEASAFTEKLLKESGEVRLTFDKELLDKYERTLAVVELRDGRILNELLLTEGLAKVLIVEPNVKMENVYKQLEQQAKQNKVGLWSSGKEASHAEVPVKKAQQEGQISLAVDKRGELVTIANLTSSPIRMDGWKLVSVRGNQTYTFDRVTLPANGTLLVYSGTEAMDEQDEDTVLIWEASNVWNNTEADPAELYNELSELVAVWEDE